MDSWSNKLILIGGLERSGSNLLISILDGHPSLVVYSEGHLHLLGAAIRDTSDKSIKGKIDYFCSLDTTKRLFSGCIKSGSEIIESNLNLLDKDKFESLLAKKIKKSDSWPKIVSYFFESFKESNSLSYNNIKGVVENTPGNEMEADTLFSLFPEAKLVMLLRDPCAVWASWSKAGEGRFDRSLWQFIAVYNIRVLKMRLNLKKFGRNRCILVRYEDLINNHATELDRLFEFLDIKRHDSSSTISKMGVPYKGNSLYGIDQSAINQFSVNAYKKKLPISVIDTINKFCSPLYSGKYANKKLSPFIFIKIINPFLQLNEIKRIPFMKNIRGILFLVFYFFRNWVRVK
jgi:hypothetical protein